MKRILIAGVSLLACSGCNAVAGFGQDMVAAGNALTQNAEDTKGVEAPKQSMPGCTPDFRRTPPVTCQKTDEPNQTQQVRLAPATQAAAATPAPASKPAAKTAKTQ